MLVNPFSVASLLLAITCLLVVIVIAIYGKTRLHKVWLLFNISVGLWGLGAFLVTQVPEGDPSRALHMWRFVMISVIFTSVFFWDVAAILCSRENRYFLRCVYAQGIAFSWLSLTSNKFCAGVWYVFDSYYYVRGGLFFGMFFCVWLLLLMCAMVQLFVTFFKSKGRQRLQLKYLLFAMVLAYGGGITNFAPAFGLSFYPLGNFTLIIYTIIVTYSTLRHRLLDLDVFITRTGIFVSVYSLVLGLPFALAFGLKEQLIKLAGYDIWWVFPLSAMAVCATAGPFLYLFIQKKAEERLLQEQNRYQSTLRQASAGMGKIKDLDRLVSLIVHIVSRAVRLEHCMIYLRDAGQKNFRLAACRSRAPRFNPTESIPADSVLVSRIVQTRGPIVWEEIRLQTEEAGDLKLARLEAELRGLNAALVVPSFDNEKLLAVMVLGKKISGRLYSDSDLAVFSILANQAALAIENALFYAQMRRTHEQLFKAEKMATIGTMAEGLSHQINNRLHALGFIAGDALDALQSKSGLAASPEIRQLLADLEDALRRIEDNVDRGGDVVRGLLKYSRKEDEGFSAVDLDQLITAVVEMIRFKVRPDELTILREYGDSLPKIRGSFAQLQEVFFNLIDNAYDAVSQRRQELKEPGYEPAIRIAASGDNNGGINITVRDNGSGIKDEDQDKLFTPFFTTKVSSRQGTGLGLYVIQRLIEENHGGRVRFTSRYGEGTTVSIYLPAAKRDTNSQ